MLTAVTGILGIVLAMPIGYLTDRVNRMWLVGIGGAHRRRR